MAELFDCWAATTWVTSLLLAYAWNQAGNSAVCDNVTAAEATAELDQPGEAVCGAIRLTAAHASRLQVAVYRLGAGRFILNNLLLRNNLGQVPVAERLLRNMLLVAGRNTDQLLAELPGDFAVHLQAIGYEP